MSGSDSEEGENNLSEEVLLTCKKCPGKYFRKGKEADEHRQFHRSQRQTGSVAVAVTGPRRSDRKRSPKDDEGAPSMFSVRVPEKTPSPKKRKDSAEERKKKALDDHRKKFPKTKKKNDGG